MARKVNNKHTDLKKSILIGDTKLGNVGKITETRKTIDSNIDTKVREQIEETTNWQSQEIETKSAPLVDDGHGRPIILRRFQFKLPPNQFVIEENKSALLKQHRTRIIAFLWKDELELIQEPKLVVEKDQNTFSIFATCQAKKGSLILNKPQTLQDVTQPHAIR